MHLIIPMSGQGRRFQAVGYSEPKPLVPVSGIPMIERVLGLFPRHWICHFVLADNHKNTKLPSLLKKLRPGSQLYFVPPHKKGPSFAALKALRAIPSNAPIFLSYCDYGMVWDSSDFEKFVFDTKCDACLISYKGFHPHYLRPTLYAYSRMRGERVVEVKEKGFFTSNRENEYASSGGYYFGSAKTLKTAIEHQMKKNLHVNGEFFTSLTVQALLDKAPNSNVRVYEVPGFFQWGTPEDLKDFEFWERTFSSVNHINGAVAGVKHVLMPMAGSGTRFLEKFGVPKPFIPLGQQPMFERALESLPSGDRTVLVTLKKNRTYLSSYLTKGKYDLVELSRTPDGQALSVDSGLKKIASTGDVVVSACDHAVVFNSDRWNSFHKNPRCDAAIFTVKGYPGAGRTPLSYAYVRSEKGKDNFPKVMNVSVKKPLSEDPQRDAVLVGTFWFRNRSVLKDGINLLKKKKVTVNREYYLDSIFELLMKTGRVVREFPLDGLICWGDQDAMAEALYWEEQFLRRKVFPRKRYG